jgi:hypothetical protein
MGPTRNADRKSGCGAAGIQINFRLDQQKLAMAALESALPVSELQALQQLWDVNAEEALWQIRIQRHEEEVRNIERIDRLDADAVGSAQRPTRNTQEAADSYYRSVAQSFALVGPPLQAIRSRLVEVRKRLRQEVARIYDDKAKERVKTPVWIRFAFDPSFPDLNRGKVNLNEVWIASWFYARPEIRNPGRISLVHVNARGLDQDRREIDLNCPDLEIQIEKGWGILAGGWYARFAIVIPDEDIEQGIAEGRSEDEKP